MLVKNSIFTVLLPISDNVSIDLIPSAPPTASSIGSEISDAIIEGLEKEKLNNTVKGDLIKNTFLTSTMGVSYKVKLEKNI